MSLGMVDVWTCYPLMRNAECVTCMYRLTTYVYIDNGGKMAKAKNPSNAENSGKSLLRIDTVTFT